MSGPSERAAFNGCQNPRCGHRHDQHEPMGGRCIAYHCHCRGWAPITEQAFERGAR